MAFSLLLESGDNLLLESGDNLLLEGEVTVSTDAYRLEYVELTGFLDYVETDA